MDIKFLQEILSKYKYLGKEKWVSKRGKASDGNKHMEVALEYLTHYPTASLEEVLLEMTRLSEDQEKQKELQRQKEQHLLNGFKAHDEVTLAASLRDSLHMQGSTWNCYRMDGRVVTKARAKTACEAMTIHYNCSIPVNPWSGKKCAPLLSKADVWTIFTQIGNDSEVLSFENLRLRLKFQKDLIYDDLASELFKLARIADNAVNRVMLKHWLANVKRSIYGERPIYNICLNLFGPQGTGKTTLSRFLTQGGDIPAGIKLPSGEILAEPRIVEGILGSDYAAEMSFHKLFDENFFAWASNYFALIVSEPAGEHNLYLDAKEVNQFKAILDCVEFTSRAYYTQETQKTPNAFSMMTSTNKHLYKIISDPTGQRRIFELEMGMDESGKAVVPNSGLYVFPYLQLWQSVDESNSCITQDHPLWKEICNIWDTYKANSTIDSFFTFSKVYGIPATDSESEPISIDELYNAYKLWTVDNHYLTQNRENFQEHLPLTVTVIGDEAMIRRKKGKALKGFISAQVPKSPEVIS